MDDPREVPITITMTATEWDALGCGGPDKDFHDRVYADHLRWEVRDRIALATPGAAERRAYAKAEVEESLPVLDRKAKNKLRAKMVRLLTKHRAGTLDVDHLGHGPDNDEYLTESIGFDVVLIPHTHNGGAAFHFRMRDVYFEHNAYPLSDKQVKWFTGTVKIITSRDPEVWGGGNWRSARFE